MLRTLFDHFFFFFISLIIAININISIATIIIGNNVIVTAPIMDNTVTIATITNKAKININIILLTSFNIFKIK